MVVRSALRWTKSISSFEGRRLISLVWSRACYRWIVGRRRGGHGADRAGVGAAQHLGDAAHHRVGERVARRGRRGEAAGRVAAATAAGRRMGRRRRADELQRTAARVQVVQQVLQRRRAKVVAHVGRLRRRAAATRRQTKIPPKKVKKI